MNSARASLLVWLFLPIAACGQQPNPLLGTWYYSGQADHSLDFRANGTVVVTQSGTTTTATYQLLGEGQVELTLPAFSKPRVYHFQRQEDRFTWSLAGASQTNSRTYQKTRPRQAKSDLSEPTNPAIDESLTLATALRTVVAEYYMENGTVPQNMDDIGVSRVPAGQYSNVRLENGNLIARFHGDSKAVEAFKNRQLALTPFTTTNGDFVWVCGVKAPYEGLVEITERQPTTIPEAFLPQTCRSQ